MKPYAKPFTYQLTVPDAAIDMFGHVNNVEYVRWIMDAATQHSLHVGYGWEQYHALGAAFVVRRHEIDYLRAAQAGDVLEVSTWILSHTRISALRATEIKNARGEPVLAARTTWVWVDFATMRPRRMPDAVRDVFGGEPVTNG